MLIWTLVILMLAAFAASGFYSGAVRTLISVVGFFLGLVLAFPLGELTQPLFVKAGLVNPLWLFVLPPVVMFVLVGLVVFGLSFLAHRMVDLHFKYRVDDVGYLQWVRLNQRLGISIGIGVGMLHVVLLLWIIHVAGYLTVQVAADSGSPAALEYLNKARTSLRESGLDRLVASVDKTPDRFYEACDLAGLIFHNPLVQGRLASYPPYIPLSEAAEFQEIASDPDYQQMLQTGVEVGTFVENPKTQAILNNKDLLAKIIEVDLKDLRTYLETGKSPKYSSERILGRWSLDPYATLIMARKLNPNMSATQMSLLRKVLTTIAPYYQVAASPDKQFWLTFKGAEQAVDSLVQSMAPQPAAPPPGAEVPAAPAMDPAIAARYGLTPGGRPPGAIPGDGSTQPQTPAPAAAQTPAGKLIARLAFSAAGTWDTTGVRYEARVRDGTGRETTFSAQAKEEELILTGPDKSSLVFLRME